MNNVKVQCTLLAVMCTGSTIYFAHQGRLEVAGVLFVLSIFWITVLTLLIYAKGLTK